MLWTYRSMHCTSWPLSAVNWTKNFLSRIFCPHWSTSVTKVGRFFAFLSTAFYSKTNPPCWLLFLFCSIFARVPAYICCSEKKNSNILFVINISMSTFPSSFLSSARCLILFYFCPKMFAQCTNSNSNSNLKIDRNLNTKIKTNTSMKIIMRTNMIINIIIIMNTIR